MATRPRREVLLAVLVLAASFTALEIVEVQHQADVEKTGLLALAVFAGVLHASAAVLAALTLTSARRRPLSVPVG